jgi:LuxR family transcriptional regulator, maltose regulon positive regulatory protein
MLRRFQGPSAYLSLNVGDRDPSQLVTSVAMALQPMFPECAMLVGDTLGTCANLDRAAVDLAGVMLSRCLSVDPPPTFLALDDIYVLGQSGVAVEALERLVSNLPSRWTLVLASRQPLPLSLDHLRGRVHMVEVEPRYFRLTPTEIIAWAEQFWDMTLSLDDARMLWRLTEGWPVSLVLLGERVQGHLRTGADVRRLLKKGRQLNRYLTDNVFSSLDPFTSEVLLAASPLGRVIFPRDEPLFPGLSGEAEGELERLVERGFLVAMTGNRTFRLHPLVCAYAERELSAGRLGEAGLVVLNAARHLERVGEPAAAVNLYLRVGELDSVRRLLRGLAASLDATSNHVRAEWLQGISDDLLLSDPWLLMAKAQVLKGRGLHGEAAPLYRAAAREMERTGGGEGLVQAYLGEAFALFMTGRWEDSFASMERAERLAGSARERAEVLCAIGHLFAVKCQWDEAVERWEEALTVVPPEDRREFEVRVDNYRAHLFFLRGECATAAGWALRATPLSVGQQPVLYATTLNNAATALCSIGRYEEARLKAEAALALVKAKHLHFLEAPVHLSLAAVCLGQEKIRAGNAFIKTALEISRRAGDVEAEVWAIDMLGELCRRHGNPGQALVHHRTAANIAAANQFSTFELCRARCNVGIDLVVLGKIAEALPELEEAGRSARTADLIGLLMMCRLYEGWCRAKAGDEAAARDALDEAMALASRHHQVHFLAQEARVATPILALADRYGLGGFVRASILPVLTGRLTAYFEQMAAGPVYPTDVRLGHAANSRFRPVAIQAPAARDEDAERLDALMAQLTERELEILRLMALGMPNKVIAGRLFITEKTIKTHANNIYHKLDVRNRVQAVLMLQQSQRRRRHGLPAGETRQSSPGPEHEPTALRVRGRSVHREG